MEAATSLRVQKRMSESVKTIGEHLLLGRSSIEVLQRKEHYEKLIREVFDRVLAGYIVEAVEIDPAKDCRIRIRLAPWGDIVRTVKIQIDYNGISPQAIHLVKKDIEKIEEDITGALLGLPLEAVDWASGVARDLIREILRRQLPEFYFSLDVEAGRDSSVRLSLFPTGQLVKTVAVSLRSNTLPNMLLVHARLALEAQSQTMRGLPVAYVQRRLPYFSELLRKTTADDRLIRPFDLAVRSSIRPAVDTEAELSVEAERARFFAEVWMDVGQNKDNISGMAHAGYKLGKRDEVFMELKVMPGTLNVELAPGWGHRFSAETWAGVRYRTNDQAWVLWLEQGLGRRWSMRLERWPAMDRNEVKLRYKLHDFLSAEFVLTNTGNWFRLVGHL